MDRRTFFKASAAAAVAAPALATIASEPAAYGLMSQVQKWQIINDDLSHLTSMQQRLGGGRYIVLPKGWDVKQLKGSIG